MRKCILFTTKQAKHKLNQHHIYKFKTTKEKMPKWPKCLITKMVSVSIESSIPVSCNNKWIGFGVIVGGNKILMFVYVFWMYVRICGKWKNNNTKKNAEGCQVEMWFDTVSVCLGESIHTYINIMNRETR